MKEEKAEVEIEALEEISQLSDRKSLEFESDMAEPFDKNHGILPERNLLRAVLDRAFQDLTKRGTMEFVSAYEWFFCESKADFYTDGDYKAFTFTGICNFLDLEKSHILKAVRRLVYGENGNVSEKEEV